MASKLNSQLPTFHKAWTLLVGGMLAFGIFYVLSLALGKLDPSGLSSFLLTPFFLGSLGAILIGSISLLLIGIKKLAKG